MKRKLLLKTCLLLFGMLTYFNSLFAVIAYPDPVEIHQPDGTTITVLLKGDERVRWAQTTDGFTILVNEKGIYEYAVSGKDGDLSLSGIAVKNVSERTPEEIEFLEDTPKGLFYSKEQVSVLKSIWDIKEMESQKAFPTTGNRKLVCILMGYKDRSFSKSQSEFNALFNQVNYSAGGATGSVKDFYLESSYDQFNLDVTVTGPYTSDYNMSYYGGNSGGNDANPRALVTEAVNKADPYVNFSDFDNDNDGTVDGVYVIYAGYGEEAGGGANAIWAHAWNISTVYKDGVAISKYSCSAELRGSSGSTITAIGVICHEFGHVLGALDYYDTNYDTGGNFIGTGKWDMMAQGSWNNGGVTPAQHNAYTKIYVYNWATATTLSSGANVSVTNSNENKSFYRINSTTTNEFWVMENRQLLGFDAQLPGHGLIIYHVHKDINSAGNQINATYPQRMYPVCASATSNPGSTPSSYGSINAGGCPFPGTSNKTSFTDNTTPNMRSWAGANTNKPITNISENSSTKTISFTFNGGGGTDTEPPTAPSGLSYSNVTSSGVNLSWTASTDNVGVDHYKIYQGGAQIGNTSATSYSVSGLSASTTYNFTVKAFDAAGNESAASNSVSVTTSPIGGDYCTSSGNDFSYEWIASVEVAGQSKTSTGSGYSNFTSTTFNLTTGSNNITLTPGFKSSTYSETWKVWIDFNGDKDFADAGEEVFTKSGTTAVSGTINIPTSATGQTRMRVSMRYNNAPTSCGSFDYGEVEDYTVSFGPPPVDTEPPTVPANLSSSNITKTGVTLTWTASTDNVGVDQYKVFMDGNEIGSTAGTSYNVTNLIPVTTYSFTVKAYDAAGNASNNSNQISVTTLDDVVSYCSSKGNNSYYFWINYVGLNTMTNTSGNNNGYADFTNQIATITPGSSERLYLQSGYSGYTYTVYWAVWIDYNQNGTFETSEKIINGSTSQTTQVYGDFTVPADAVAGNTRMRISMKYGSEATSCETFTYGEVEDYTVSISQSGSYGTFSDNSGATELDDVIESDIIYPMPVKNKLYASLKVVPGSEVSILSTSGQVLKTYRVNDEIIELDVSELGSGLYFLQYNNGLENKVKKFIKE